MHAEAVHVAVVRWTAKLVHQLLQWLVDETAVLRTDWGEVFTLHLTQVRARHLVVQQVGHFNVLNLILTCPVADPIGYLCRLPLIRRLVCPVVVWSFHVNVVLWFIFSYFYGKEVIINDYLPSIRQGLQSVWCWLPKSTSYWSTSSTHLKISERVECEPSIWWDPRWWWLWWWLPPTNAPPIKAIVPLPLISSWLPFGGGLKLMSESEKECRYSFESVGVEKKGSTRLVDISKVLMFRCCFFSMSFLLSAHSDTVWPLELLVSPI